MSRASFLTTYDLHVLDMACRPIRVAFGPPYLVGTAGDGESGGYRDVDVRLILADDEFDQLCGRREVWEVLCLGFTAWLRQQTALPIDFQIQRQSQANEKFGDKRRNPLGMKRVFAGGGDAGAFVHDMDEPHPVDSTQEE